MEYNQGNPSKVFIMLSQIGIEINYTTIPSYDIQSANIKINEGYTKIYLAFSTYIYFPTLKDTLNKNLKMPTVAPSLVGFD